MAAITFNTAHQTEHGRLETVLAVLRDMLDGFVSHRIRLAAAEAEHARPRPDASSSSRNAR